MPAFAWSLNTCQHCGKPSSNDARPQPVLDTKQLEDTIKTQRDLYQQMNKENDDAKK